MIWLDEGRIAAEGTPREVVGQYLQKLLVPVTERVWPDPLQAPGSDGIRLRRVAVRPVTGTPIERITLETPFQIEVEYWNLRPGARFHVSLNVINEEGILLFRTSPPARSDGQNGARPEGLFRDVCHVPEHLLNEGVHRVELLVDRDHVHNEFRKEDALIFDVVGSAHPGPWEGKWHGAVRPVLQWSSSRMVGDGS